MGKHSCQGHTAAIRHERASPKSNVSKTGKRQARICKGVLKVSFPGESEPWKILDIEQFMNQCQHAVMERSIVAYPEACDWDRMRYNQDLPGKYNTKVASRASSGLVRPGTTDHTDIPKPVYGIRTMPAYITVFPSPYEIHRSLRVLLPFFSLAVVRSGKNPFFTSLFTRVNSFEIPGFVEFSMKTLQECIT